MWRRKSRVFCTKAFFSGIFLWKFPLPTSSLFFKLPPSLRAYLYPPTLSHFFVSPSVQIFRCPRMGPSLAAAHIQYIETTTTTTTTGSGGDTDIPCPPDPYTALAHAKVAPSPSLSPSECQGRESEGERASFKVWPLNFLHALKPVTGPKRHKGEKGDIRGRAKECKMNVQLEAFLNNSLSPIYE